MVHYCCVPQCKNKWESEGSKKLRFHSFPKSPVLRKRWQDRVKSGKRPTPSMKICSGHFLSSDYYSTRLGYQFLKKSAVPSQQLPVLPNDRMKKKFPRYVEKAARKHNDCHNFDLNEPTSDLFDKEDSSSGCSENAIEVCMEFPRFIGREETCSTSEPVKMINVHNGCMELSAAPGESKSCLFVQQGIFEKARNCCHSCGLRMQLVNGTSEDEQQSCKEKSVQTYAQIRENQYISLGNVTASDLKYFCGLDRVRFDAVYFYLMQTPHPIPKCALDAQDQLLLTLTKYKLNLDFTLLSVLFRVDRRLVSQIFYYWTKYMYSKFKLIDLWSLRVKGEGVYTAVMDCTEIRTVRSGSPEIHQQLFSNYKNNPTLKGLVVIDENGTVIFCSDLYGGSTSDKEMVELSGILDLLQKGDIVLADRGFDISDVLEKYGVALNIPPFRRGGHNQLEESEVMFTRFVAQRRIHIERVIGLGKINQILVDIMPEHLWDIATLIFFNCMVLCNFKMGIVSHE